MQGEQLRRRECQGAELAQADPWRDKEACVPRALCFPHVTRAILFVFLYCGWPLPQWTGAARSPEQPGPASSRLHTGFRNCSWSEWAVWLAPWVQRRLSGGDRFCPPQTIGPCFRPVSAPCPRVATARDSLDLPKKMPPPPGRLPRLPRSSLVLAPWPLTPACTIAGRSPVGARCPVFALKRPAGRPPPAPLPLPLPAALRPGTSCEGPGRPGYGAGGGSGCRWHRSAVASR